MTGKDDFDLYSRAVYSTGWLDGFSAILWDLVGEKLSDEMVVEYESHVRRVRESMRVKEDDPWRN